MTDREWRGYWWLPGQEADKVPGTLRQREEDGEVVLKLIGGFSVEVVTPIDGRQSSVSIDGAFPMVLGSSAGQPFTLLQCHARHTSGGFTMLNIVEQDISVQRALRGIHLTDPEEEVFDKAVLNVEYLLGWMQRTTLQASVEFDEWKWTGNQTASTSPVGELTAVHDGHEYTLNVVFNQFQIEDRPRANERSISNREWGELSISAKTPTRFTRFDEVSKAIMDLMTLAAHAPAGILRETVCFTPSQRHFAAGGPVSAHVEVMGQQIHQPKPGAKETAHVDYLFALDDIEFAAVLPAWLDLHGRAWLACSMLFGLSYVQEGYTASRLLTVATAAESLHRALHPTEEMYFKDRLAALAAEPDAKAVSRLITDIPRWAEYVKNQRNGMAHGDRKRMSADTGRVVFDAFEITRALLGLVLMSRVGLSIAVQTRAVNLPYLSMMIEEFNRALPDT